MRFRRPSPATIIAIVALVVALGGTSYAALKLPKNSVGAKQLKANAVTGAKVKPGSLSASDFGGALPAGQPGAKGEPGANGTNGKDGADGTDGTNGADGATLVAHARCPASVGPCGVSSNHTSTTVPLPGVKDWTQGSNDAAQVEIRVAWQPADVCAGGTGSQVVVLDSTVEIAKFQSPPSPTGLISEKSVHLFPPGALGHGLTVQVADNCNAGSGEATVGEAKIDVVRFKPLQ